MVACDELGQTLVHWAMAEDSKCGEKLLTFILDKGADPDSENYYGKRPKDVAVRNDKIKLAMLLCKYKVEFQDIYPFVLFIIHSKYILKKEILSNANYKTNFIKITQKCNWY